MDSESKNSAATSPDITEDELNSLNRRELFAFKKESSALKFQTQGWRKKSVSESIFKKWTRDEHITFVAGLKELGLSADSEVKDDQWVKLSQLVAGRSAYDLKLHARVFWQSPAAAAAEEKAASAGQKREFMEPSHTEARKKHRPDSPADESAVVSPANSVGSDTMDAVLSGSLSLTSSMLGLYLSSANDDTPPSTSPLTSPPAASSSSSSSSLSASPLSSIMPNSAAAALGLGDVGFGGTMNDIMANQLLEENVQIITIIRENLVNGNIKINYSLMRKFAANISRILKWQSMQPVCANMPPLPVKLNTSFLTSPSSSQQQLQQQQHQSFLRTGAAPLFPPVLGSFSHNPPLSSSITASPPSLFSSSSPLSASPVSSSSTSTSSPPTVNSRRGVNPAAPILISPPSSPALVVYTQSFN